MHRRRPRLRHEEDGRTNQEIQDAQNSADELVGVEDVLSSAAIEAGEHARDLAPLRIHGVFPAGVLAAASC
jgi:hypothetical protein